MSRELDELEREFADLEPGGDGGRGDSGGPRRGGPRILPIAVAVIALAAFGAIVWYAYNQGVRSGSEEAAPLLTPEGAAKVQPQDPGGMEVPHTDKQVYNRISGEEEGEERVERILPPPEDPMQPPPPEPEISAQAERAPPAVETPDLSAPAESAQEAAPAPEEPPLPDEKLAAPAEEPPTAAPADAEPSAPPEPEPEPEPQAAPEETQQAAVDPASAWRVQIAALRSEADARAAWDRLQSAHSEQLGGLTLSIQQAEVNGTNYFRVRGGPLENRAAAKAICDALAAKDQGCLVVKPGG